MLWDVLRDWKAEPVQTHVPKASLEIQTIDLFAVLPSINSSGSAQGGVDEEKLPISYCFDNWPWTMSFTSGGRQIDLWSTINWFLSWMWNQRTKSSFALRKSSKNSASTLRWSKCLATHLGDWLGARAIRLRFVRKCFLLCAWGNLYGSAALLNKSCLFQRSVLSSSGGIYSKDANPPSYGMSLKCSSLWKVISSLFLDHKVVPYLQGTLPSYQNKKNLFQFFQLISAVHAVA